MRAIALSYLENEQITSFNERHYSDGGRAVTATVDFDADADGRFRDRSFLAWYCVGLEERVKSRSDALRKEGYPVKGVMDYRHLFREIRYHYLAYRCIRPNARLLGRIRSRCVRADLNFDERRLFSLPMYLLPVKKRPDKTLEADGQSVKPSDD